MYKKWMAWLIIMALCCACFSPALAEDVICGDVDSPATPAQWSGAPGLFAETDGDPGLDLPPDAQEGSVLALEATEPQTTEAPQGEAVESAATQAPDPSEAPQSTEAPQATEAPVAAKSLKLSAKKLSIGLKESTYALKATLLPQNSTGSVTWRSSNAKIVAVNSKTGRLTGKKKGTATIYAKLGNVQRSCKVTVVDAPKKVTLSATKLKLSVGQRYTLKAGLTENTASTLTYTSGNKAVAEVDGQGVVTALQPGTAKITVKTFNKKSAACTVTVLPEPDQVTLPAAISLVEGERKKLATVSLAANGKKTVAEYTYAAEDGTGKVTVDPATGEVEGVSPGTAYVRVTTHNGVNSHVESGERVETVCAVEVKIGPAMVKLSDSSVTLGVKQSFALAPQIYGSDGELMKNEKFTVKSSNAKKVSVTAKGVIKGLGKGTYTVTVTAVNGVSAKCVVKVVDAPTSVKLTPSSPVIGVGQSLQLKAAFNSGAMASCTYSTSNSNVVAVSKTGVITGKKTGTATVKVKTHNSKTAKITVTVKKGPRFLTLNGDYELTYDLLTGAYNAVYNVDLNKGDTFQITYENEYMTVGDIVEYQSLNPGVATVSQNGNVTAVSGGEADILVVSSSGAKATLRVNVSGAKAASIGFSANEVSLQAGQSVASPALTGENITAAALAGAKLSSSDKRVFKVYWSDAEDCWMLTGKKPGTATLTATAAGAKAEAVVQVTEAQTGESIAFEYGLIYMNAGEVCAPTVTDSLGRTVDVQLFSDDTGVVSASEDGKLTAVGEGSATITATCGSLSAQMAVKVVASAATVTLDIDQARLGVGQRMTLKGVVNGDGGASTLTFESSNSAVATVSRTGRVIARSVGMAVITASIGSGASASCEVNVAPAPTSLSLQPASISKRLDAKGEQLKWEFGSPDEVGTVSFTSLDADVAEVSAKGYVRFKSVGKTQVTAVTNNGLSVTIDVSVLAEEPQTGTPTYRLFAAYSYADSSLDHYLPFTANNGKSIAKVFEQSSIGGLTYKTRVMGNPGKTQLLSGISAFFADSADDDVSIVYLCAHGHMNSDYTGYRMSLPGYSDHPSNPNYYMSAQEIFNCLRRIRGSVILILDSCYSGAFLEDMTGQLKAQNGRIAVITAASDTRATYYNVKDTSKAVDFLTFFLLQGLGYNEREGWWNANASGGRGSYPGYLAADRAANSDGIVTLSEFYRYAANCIDVNIPNYMKKSWYWGDKKRVQVTRYYGGKLDDLVIYQPKE